MEILSTSPGKERWQTRVEKNRLTIHTQTLPLKLAYHRMFWRVSRKGQRWPFGPDDEWAGLTGHLSLASFTLVPWIRLSCSSSLFCKPPSPARSHSLPPSTGGRETDSARWQIYWHRHGVKHLKHSVTLEDPLPGRQDWSAIYICWGSCKVQLLYISLTLACIS